LRRRRSPAANFLFFVDGAYVDEVMLDLGDNVTPQIGPIPRNY
jgi:hypothetical protein